MKIETVQRWVASVILIHVGSVPAVWLSGVLGVGVAEDDRGKGIGLWFMSGVIGLLTVAGVLAIFRRSPLSPWMVLGAAPTAATAAGSSKDEKSVMFGSCGSPGGIAEFEHAISTSDLSGSSPVLAVAGFVLTQYLADRSSPGLGETVVVPAGSTRRRLPRRLLLLRRAARRRCRRLIRVDRG